MEKIEKDMTPKLIGDTWLKYPTERSSKKDRYGLFECQYCNNTFECRITSVNRGDTKSCGCKKKGINKTHGLTNSRFYRTWCNLIYRCSDIKNKDYINYGGRGIKVCEEWLDVRNFIAWCDSTYPNISGLSLDRIDNDKGYSPENCRWVGASTQALNRRVQKNNKSGFVGITWRKRDSVWASNIYVNNKLKHIGYYETIEEAVEARDNYIIENNLPYKLSTDYKREESQ